MRGFAIILGFNFVGLALQKWAHCPLPAGVCGLILFSACLFAGWIKLEWVEDSAQFLLNHLMLFFAPVIVGTMALFPLIGQNWLPIVTSLLGSTFLVMIIAGWTTRLLERKEACADEPNDVFANPLFGFTLTVTVYAASKALAQRIRWLHPLFVTSVLLIGFLLLFGIPYGSYRVGGEMIAFFLGPATVALGVPLYKNARLIRRNLGSVLVGITAGSVAGMASAGLIVLWLGGTREIMLSMIPKSATTPISMDISASIGGYPELTATVTVLTGLLGSMVGPEVLRLIGIRRDISLGTAIGTSAHGIGTARVLAENELAGSVSGFAMGAAGIVHSLLAIPLS